MKPRPFRIIPTSEWGAKPPRHPIEVVTAHPDKALFHHTAGTAPHLDTKPSESLAEAIAYARAIQSFHMGPERGWSDTGQNFLVARAGYIFEGRHGSRAACRRGHMVVSAHCPGQNTQPGVEIEHYGSEAMTPIQREAAVWLFAHLCRWGRFPASHIFGHRDFYSTDCPGVLYAQLPSFRVAVSKHMAGKDHPQPPHEQPKLWQVVANHHVIYTTPDHEAAVELAKWIAHAKVRLKP